MIPCMICGKDASTSWVYGFSPAPDSLKAGLCHEHNSQQNRKYVVARWQKEQEREIEVIGEVSLYKAAPNAKKLVVHYFGGGIATFSCTAFQTIGHDIEGSAGSLRIDELDGSQTFIPLAHVKKYTAYPMRPDEACRALTTHHSDEKEKAAGDLTETSYTLESLPPLVPGLIPPKDEE